MPLPLGIPPLPAPPPSDMATAAANGFRPQHHSWLPAPPPSSAFVPDPPMDMGPSTYTPAVNPGVLIPRLPMSGPYPSPPVPGPSSSAQRQWKNYMRALGGHMQRLDVNTATAESGSSSGGSARVSSSSSTSASSADKPLPSIPHGRRPSRGAKPASGSPHSAPPVSRHPVQQQQPPRTAPFLPSSGSGGPPPVPPRPPRLSSLSPGGAGATSAPQTMYGGGSPNVQLQVTASAPATPAGRVVSSSRVAGPSASSSSRVSTASRISTASTAGSIKLLRPTAPINLNPIAPVTPLVKPRAKSAAPARPALPAVIDLTGDSDESFMPSSHDSPSDSSPSPNTSFGSSSASNAASPPNRPPRNPRRTAVARRVVSAHPRLQDGSKSGSTSMSATGSPAKRSAPAKKVTPLTSPRTTVPASPRTPLSPKTVATSPKTPVTRASAVSTAASSAQSTPRSSTPGAVRCAGFTRSGAPCKRLVKIAAPFLAARDDTAGGDDGDVDAERVIGRYCKDHAGLVCFPAGFYWRDARGKAGIWVDFADFIPSDLGQQTQTLMRMTMESPLTAKELPGFLYAYELRDLTAAATDTAYFKVGRTDNVPRRIGQWSNQCTSHAPTLRDIFPLKAPPTHPSGTSLHRACSIAGGASLLPGAVRGGVDAARMVPAVKRWERLVHLELADRAASQRQAEYDAVLSACGDCGAVHREIFPLADDMGGGRGGGVYEEVVVDAVGRWERFVRLICEVGDDE